MNTTPSLSEQYAAALTKKSARLTAEKQLSGAQYSQYAKPYVYHVQAGKKFDRIVSENGGASVHAFVERATGRLIKPATWQAPAKDKHGIPAYRYDLSTPEGFLEAISNADDYGSYLYADYTVCTPSGDEYEAAGLEYPWAKTAAADTVSHRVTITLDLLAQPKDQAHPLTWGKFRELIGYHTPAMGSLEVREGLHGDITAELVYGDLSITVKEV